MTDRRGNQTGHEVDLPEDQGMGDLFNPGHAPLSGVPRADLVDIDAEQDISDGAKVTLGKYLSDSTKGRVGVGRPNVFQVPGPDSRLNQANSSVDPNASTFNGPLAATELKIDGKTDGTFLDVVAGNDPIAAVKFKMTSAGQYGDDGTVNPFQIIKSVSSAAQGLAPSLSKIPGAPSGLFDAVGNALSISGHNLLLQITQQGSAGNAELGNPAVGRTASVLSQLTSPNLVQPAISSVLTNNRFNQIDRAFVQNHERTGTGAVIQARLGRNTQRGGYELSEKDLQTIPDHITSQAAGIDGKNSSPDRRATGRPTISSQDLRASQAVGVKTKYSDTELTNEDDVFSYGTLYTSSEGFETDASLEVAYEISAVSINASIDRAVQARDAGYKIEGDADWFKTFLIGLSAFYGTEFVDENARLDTQNLPDDFKGRISSSPGYYVAVARGALREADGDISTVESWRFIVAMVVLGDRSLQSRFTPSTRSRTRAPGQPLEWSHLASPRSAYVLPSSLIQANNMLYTAGAASNSLLTVPGEEFSGRRLGPEDVREIEDVLEGEYVPFYFHDVRTNEVIAFHAFLSSLTDGFAANYNTTTGYGRAEDVMVYNNTKRSIGFDFHLVATSKDDHDALYWNVNKLVSMLYPQYSRGRTVVSGGQRFIQPFSQIPTASPLVRIRIGDVVKSNYSRFGLARLFGLGQDGQVISSQSAVRIEEYERKLVEASALARAELEIAEEFIRTRGPVNDDEGVSKIGIPGGPQFARVSVFGRQSLRMLRNNEGQLLTDNKDAEAQVLQNLLRLPPPVQGTEIGLSAGFVIKEATEVSVSRVSEKDEEPPRAELSIVKNRFTLKILALQLEVGTRSYVLNETSSPKLSDVLGEYNWIDLDFFTLNGPGTLAGSGTGAFSLTPAQREEILSQKIAEKKRELGAGQEPRGYDVIRNFFNPDGSGGNPIVRSFESSRGRGMAGFITGMTMDWADSTWEIEEGSRAPISLKISVTFSPIHDIPLGLDSDGVMRSVAYGVGRHSNALGGDPYDGLSE